MVSVARTPWIFPCASLPNSFDKRFSEKALFGSRCNQSNLSFFQLEEKICCATCCDCRGTLGTFAEGGVNRWRTGEVYSRTFVARPRSWAISFTAALVEPPSARPGNGDGFWRAARISLMTLCMSSTGLNFGIGIECGKKSTVLQLRTRRELGI